MAGFNIRQGRKESSENLSYSEGGDCPRCGGEKTPSSMTGYLKCISCSYEWPDPEHQGTSKRLEPDNYRRDSQLIEDFKQEMKSGSMSNALGIDKQLTEEQEASLSRLEDKWMRGMQGHFNAATEERKPLMISFDDDDELVSTVIAQLQIVDNGFDGGEEIRLEYPGMGTEFYTFNEMSPTGWKRGPKAEMTARSIANVINRSSRFVYADSDGNTINFEMRDSSLKPESLVLFIDDPEGKNFVATKAGISLDARDVRVIEDYHNVVALVLEDGIISPSEDQMLWAMRQQLGISDEYHVQIIQELFGDNATKECTNCGGLAELYPEYSAWYCHPCEAWL